MTLAEALAHLSWGATAESALERVMVELPRDRLNLLVSRHVMARPDSAERPDYTGAAQSRVEHELAELGIPLYDAGDEWSVELPGDTRLSREYGPAAEEGGGDDDVERLDRRGEALCRLGLYAVWLRTMRKREADAEGP